MLGKGHGWREGCSRTNWGDEWFLCELLVRYDLLIFYQNKRDSPEAHLDMVVIPSSCWGEAFPSFLLATVALFPFSEEWCVKGCEWIGHGSIKQSLGTRSGLRPWLTYNPREAPPSKGCRHFFWSFNKVTNWSLWTFFLSFSCVVYRE